LLSDLLLNYVSKISGTEILHLEKKDDDYEISLRFITMPLRQSWPEDMLFSWSASEIYMCFHTININLQNDIFNGIVELLNRLEIPFVEEED